MTDTSRPRGYANRITREGAAFTARVRAEFPADPDEFRAAVTPELPNTTVRELADEMGVSPDQVRDALDGLYDEAAPRHDDLILSGFQAAQVVKWYDEVRTAAEQWEDQRAGAEPQTYDY